MITYPDIDPIIFRINDQMAVSWYSLAYFFGIIFCISFSKYLNKKFNLKLTDKNIDDFFGYGILGIVIGGRLGYCFLYDFIKYIHNPLDILKTWEGGMSFHGGLVGFCVASYIFSNKYKLEFLRLLDITATSVGLGIFLGRIANFINCELYGRETSAKIGMIFPCDALLKIRHPSQLYEAFFEGFVILTTTVIFAVKYRKILNKGFCSTLFLTQYTFFRFVIEFFREPDPQKGFYLTYFTFGQILNFLMFVIGILILKNITNEKNTI